MNCFESEHIGIVNRLSMYEFFEERVTMLVYGLLIESRSRPMDS